MSNYWQAAILLVVGLGFFFFYRDLQPPVDYPQAPLFDGNQYLKIRAFLAGNTESYQVSFPYNGRVLVPFLSLLVPVEDPIAAFEILNLLFTLASLGVIFLLWKDLRLSPLYRFAGFFWLVFHWTGIVRLNLFDPVTVDLPLYLFQALLVLIVLRKKFFWLLGLAPIATAQKESFLVLMMVLSAYGLFYRRELDKKDLTYIGLALLLSLLVKVGLSRIFPPLEPDRNSLITIAYHLKLLALDPFRILRWIAAIFVAYGGLLLVSLQGVSWKKFNQEELLLAGFTAVYFLFGLVAGGDMLRIVFLGFPFVMTLILLRLRDHADNLVIIGLVLSLPLMKLRSVIPDPVNSWEDFAEWYPEYASWQMVLIWLGYGLVVFWVTWGWKRWKG